MRTLKLMVTLAVIGMLGGQRLSYADDGAASGAVAVQEPENATDDSLQDGDSESLEAAETSFEGESEANYSDDGENASEGSETAGEGD